MTNTQPHPSNHTQDLYDQIMKLTELLANSCASLAAMERERARWEQRSMFMEEEIEELMDPEVWCFYQRIRLVTPGDS